MACKKYHKIRHHLYGYIDTTQNCNGAIWLKDSMMQIKKLLSMNKIPMTAEGYSKLQDELKKLTSEDRPNIIAAIAEARGHGDLSENAEYHAAKEKQSFIEGRIADLENKISRAEVINTRVLSGDKIIFGATVTLGEVGRKKNIVYQIVGTLKLEDLVQFYFYQHTTITKFVIHQKEHHLQKNNGS